MNTEKLYKVGDLVPKTGKYICIVCEYIMDFKEGDKFIICPVCLAGQEGGPKGPDEGFWKLLEN
jgi:hypothetical protein